MRIYWRPHHEVYPELPREPDFLAFDEETEKSIGRVCLEKQSTNAGCWRWSMFAHSNTGRVPFETHGYEDRRGDAGRRVVEAYRALLEHNERHPRKAPRGSEQPAGLGVSFPGLMRNAARAQDGAGRLSGRCARRRMRRKVFGRPMVVRWRETKHSFATTPGEAKQGST